MASLALLMIAAHMVGDYILQTNGMAKRKMFSNLYDPDYEGWRHRLIEHTAATIVRTVHVFLYTLAFLPVCFVAHMTGHTPLLFLLSIFVPHWIVDCRRWASPQPWAPKPILVDQSIHAACLAATAVLFNL